MTTTYPFTIATAIPGGQWMPENNQNQSDHLVDLIKTTIAVASGETPTNPLEDVSSPDGVTLNVSFQDPLSSGDQTTLAELVARSADYFIVTIDGGVTDLGLGAEVQKVAGLLSSFTVTLQLKDGAGVNRAVAGQDVVLRPRSLCPINKTSGEFDSNGRFAYTLGASLDRGEVDVEMEAGSLPPRVLTARWA